MNNALTIDVEDWYQTEFLASAFPGRPPGEERLEQSTQTILDLLAGAGIKGTFFVLGCVAEKHPQLVRAIVGEGHELACHGYDHKMVTAMTRQGFRQDIRKAKALLEDTAGVAVAGYRAPTWSITAETLWALPILEEEGFRYDSSIQPFKTPLSGFPNAPLTLYLSMVGGRELTLLEAPPGVAQWGGLRIPFAGGAYFRILPYALISCLLRSMNRKRPVVTYFHPWEVDPGQPRLKIKLWARFIHYYHIADNAAKLEKFLKEFAFIPLGELIASQQDYPYCRLDAPGDVTG